jgi:thiamine biosynthesis lipoprotein
VILKDLTRGVGTRRTFLRAGAAAALLVFPRPVRALLHRQVFVERVFLCMGSPLRFAVYARDRAHGVHAISEGMRVFRRAEQLFSVYSPSSEITLLNRTAGREMVAVSHETMDLLHAAIRYQEITRGAFRIGVEPLMRLWGFRDNSPARHTLPSDRRIRETNATVRMDALVLDGRERTAGLRYPDSRIDPCGIAVGFAIDRCIQVLQAEGVESAFVNHSGDAFALGAPPEEAGWPVGIPDPSAGPDQLRRISLNDRAIATSSNRMNQVRIGNVRYGHIMDCGSGWPVPSRYSLSVVAHSALQADALSTGLFSLQDPHLRLTLARAQRVECYTVGEESP